MRPFGAIAPNKKAIAIGSRVHVVSPQENRFRYSYLEVSTHQATSSKIQDSNG
ncbi:MAG: hypothetical protein AAGD09_22805 [Cyanobacteria bacterium P01_F01_bin.56]